MMFSGSTHIHPLSMGKTVFIVLMGFVGIGLFCTNPNPENEVKIKSQFISVTEYLTPDTPDLLDIRLAWQSLGYNDQAFEFISLILIFVTHEKRSKVFAGQGDYELEAHVGSTSCSVSPNRCQSSIIFKAA